MDPCDTQLMHHLEKYRLDYLPFLCLSFAQFSADLFFLLLQRRRRRLHAKAEKLGIRDEAENREKSSKIRDSQYWNLLSAFYLTKTLLSAITICTLARLGVFLTFLICSEAENEESWALKRVKKKWRKKDKSIACEFAYTSRSEAEIPKFCKKFPSHTYNSGSVKME